MSIMMIDTRNTTNTRQEPIWVVQFSKFSRRFYTGKITEQQTGTLLGTTQS